MSDDTTNETPSIRTAKVVIEAIVELGDEEHYARGSTLAEQVTADSEADPAYFMVGQIVDWKIISVLPHSGSSGDNQ